MIGQLSALRFHTLGHINGESGNGYHKELRDFNLAIFYQTREYNQSIRLFVWSESERAAIGCEGLAILHRFVAKHLRAFGYFNEWDFHAVLRLHYHNFVRQIAE